MKQKLYTQGITIFLTPEMFEMVKKESDERKCSMSDLVRLSIRCFFDEIEDAKQRELEEQQKWERECEKRSRRDSEEDEL